MNHIGYNKCCRHSSHHHVFSLHRISYHPHSSPRMSNHMPRDQGLWFDVAAAHGASRHTYLMRVGAENDVSRDSGAVSEEHRATFKRYVSRARQIETWVLDTRINESIIVAPERSISTSLTVMITICLITYHNALATHTPNISGDGSSGM